MHTLSLLMIFVLALMAESAFGATEAGQLSDRPVQGCPLVLGDASLNTTVSRGDGALLLKMEPVRYGSCSRFKALRLSKSRRQEVETTKDQAQTLRQSAYFHRCWPPQWWKYGR